MIRRLVLIRHAHRDTTHREQDNGLSEKGGAQAESVARLFHENFKNQKALILSSPRKRCRETVEPLAKQAHAQVQIEPLLLEQEAQESDAAFFSRIERFIEEWKEGQAALTVACSHGDWLPLALEQLCKQMVQMKKGAWAEVTLENNKTRLDQLIQTP